MEEKVARNLVRDRCDQFAFERLCTFEAMLRLEATRQNLIAASTLDQLWARHFLDSAQIVDHVKSARTRPKLLDLGSGAGLPGLILAIMRPAWNVILVESRRLRVDWLRASAATLRCENVTIEGRNVTQVGVVEADIITARAFAPLHRLLSLSARFSTPLTEWVLPKGRLASQEVSELPHGLREMFHVEHSLSDPTAGVIVGIGEVRAFR